MSTVSSRYLGPVAKKFKGRTTAWTEILWLPEFDTRTKPPHNAKFQHVPLALGLMTPLRLQQTWAPQRARQCVRRIRKRVASHPLFARDAFGKSMGVAHTEWSPHALQAWNLEEPPSPYEVACYLLGQPPGGERPLQRAGVITYKCSRLHASAFQWWLMGVGDEALLDILPQWEQMRAESIRALMGGPDFALWALATSMVPVIRNPRQARALLFPSEKGPRRSYEGMRRRMFETTYVQAMLKMGKRPHPVSRPLPATAPLFFSWAEKARFLENLPRIERESLPRERGVIWWYMKGMEKYRTPEDAQAQGALDRAFYTEGRKEPMT